MGFGGLADRAGGGTVDRRVGGGGGWLVRGFVVGLDDRTRNSGADGGAAVASLREHEYSHKKADLFVFLVRDVDGCEKEAGRCMIGMRDERRAYALEDTADPEEPTIRNVLCNVSGYDGPDEETKEV